MKTAEAKTLASNTRQNSSFFGKGRGINGDFFSKNSATEYFFDTRPNSFIQPKLTIGQPGDKYEKEADAMSDKVVQRLSENGPEITFENENSLQTKPIAAVRTFTPFVQTKCAACEHEEKLQKKEYELEGNEMLNGKLQKKPIFESNPEPTDDKNSQRKCEEEDVEKSQTKSESNSSQTASQYIEKSLNSSKGSGTPLPDNTRVRMESSFGTDFSGVRVHIDSSAVQMNKELRAQAFTYGSDIYFNAGKYNPDNKDGQKLLAHELTHTIQQGAGIQGKLIQRMLPCPVHPPVITTPYTDWRPYPHSTTWFHCGFRTFLENRPPTPTDPMNECVYDNSDVLVDASHPYAGCRGTPDQYDGHGGMSTPHDTLMHIFCDSGGIVAEGLPALITSGRFLINSTIDSSTIIPTFLKPGLIASVDFVFGIIEGFAEAIFLPIKTLIGMICALIQLIIRAIRAGIAAITSLLTTITSIVASGVMALYRYIMSII